MFKNKVLHRLGIAGVAGAALLIAGQAQAQNNLPAAASTCAVSSTSFTQNWLATSQSTGTLSFNPPNSTTFPNGGFTGDCAFYQWGSQMFLWLLSTQSNGALQLFSAPLYNAVPQSSGGFQLVANPGSSYSLAKVNGISKPKVAFSTRVNKPLPKAAALAATNSTPSVPSPAQADDGVLVVKGTPIVVNKSTGESIYPLVYYSIMVNDVYAALWQNQNPSNVPNYYYTASAATQYNFPASAANVSQIAQAAGKTLAGANQMTFEVKSSWVDTAFLTTAQAANLVQIVADVPTYTSTGGGSAPLVLSPTGNTQQRTLALVGLHVAGSVNGHPEMSWATFESVLNAPDNTYAYNNSQNTVTTVQFSTSSQNAVTASGTTMPYVFYSGGGAITPVETASYKNGNITFPSGAVTATNVTRLNPWGSQQPASPTSSNSIVQNNTMLVSLNQSLATQLLAQKNSNGGILANYLQIGSIWGNGTVSGTYTVPENTGYNIFGSLYLANTTMETFEQQTSSNPGVTQNCFTCHANYNATSTKANPNTGVSQIFGSISGVQN